MQHLTETKCSTYSAFHQSHFEQIYSFCLCKTDDPANALTITNEAFNSLREQWDTLPSTEREAFLVRTANTDCDNRYEQLRRAAVDKMIACMSVN